MPPRGYRSAGGFVPQAIGVGWIPTDDGDRALEASYLIVLATGGSVDLVATTSAAQRVEDLGLRARRAADGIAAGPGVPVAMHAEVADAVDELVKRSGDLDLIVLGRHGPLGACRRAWCEVQRPAI